MTAWITGKSTTDALQAIEIAAGRERPFVDAPRTLDLDLIAHVRHRPDAVVDEAAHGVVLLPVGGVQRQVEVVGEVLEVPADGVRLREQVVRVAGEPHLRIVGKEGVPVVPQVELLLLEEVVLLVDGDEQAVARMDLEERARRGVPFQDEVVTTLLLQEVPHLQSPRPGAEDDVLVVHFRSLPC